VASRDEILDFCGRLLEAGTFEDYGPNGLQVPGNPEVSRVATGVSANQAFLQAAVDSGAELAIVHHGLFWGGDPQALSELMAGRLRILLAAEASLAAYHLPLDAHREVGNNALLCEGLGFELGEPFSELRGRPIGIIGRDREGVDPQELRRRVAELTGREPLMFASGPEKVHTIGIVSGGASDQVRDAIALGLDAYLTGEPSEPAMGEAEEGGIHFIAAGHYATETFGVRKLGEQVSERFEVEHEFIDVPNPI
jgi:dinuclear metal center YbgI/SA1388 family protein